MRKILLEKLNTLKNLITAVNSDVVVLINTSAIIEIQLRKKDLSKKQFRDIEKEIDRLISRYSHIH